MAALENRQFSMGPGDLQRDYMGSRDVAGALCKLLASDTETTVNICSGEGLTLGEIATSVFSLCNADPALIKQDRRLGGQGVPRRLVGDDTLLRKKIGFLAGDNFIEGLRSSVEWWNWHLK
jgi:nucleoside-diphosphate-sugar epimerase